MKRAFYGRATCAAVVPVAGIAAGLEAQEPEPAAQSPGLVAIDYKTFYRQLMLLGMVSQVLDSSLNVDADAKSNRLRLLAPLRPQTAVQGFPDP